MAPGLARRPTPDADPRLTFVTSGLDLDDRGRSLVWEFICHLPKRRAWAHLSLEPLAEVADPDHAPIVLVQRIRPAAAAEHPTALPHRFRDSSDVVAEFAAAGVDFVAGRTDMKLEGRVLASGKAVWLTYD